MSQPQEPQPEAVEQVSDPIDNATALEMAQDWIENNLVGGTIVSGDDPWEEDGRLYFVAGRGGTDSSNVLNNCPKVFVDLATGEVGWTEITPEEEPTNG